MPNPVLSKIILPTGTEYDIKDAQARSDIADIQAAIAGGLKFLGETTTPLTDKATTNPITINGDSVTAVAGNLVLYGNKEFLFDGTKWLEMGDLSVLGALAFKSSASGSYTPAGTVSQPTSSGSSMSSTGKFTPAGTVSQPTFSGSSMSSTGKFTPAGSVSVATATTENKTATVSKAASGDATYTPEGTVGAPTITLATGGSTTAVNSMKTTGSLPSLSTTVANETLTIAFDQGSLPTSEEKTVKTGDASYEASAPAFTGTGARLVTGNIPVPATFTGNFTGTEDDVSVTGTPSGTVSQPTFTGTAATITVE